MDAFLDFLGLYRSDVAKDGSCLFRVVSEQVSVVNIILIIYNIFPAVFYLM